MSNNEWDKVLQGEKLRQVALLTNFCQFPFLTAFSGEMGKVSDNHEFD